MPLTRDRIREREITVGVVGLGYVGLPLCLAFAESGIAVLGFDVDATKADAIMAGRSYLKHIAAERIADPVAAQRLRATSDFTAVADCDALLICVPTPIDEHLQPDLSYVCDTAAAIAPHLRRDTLVVLESTTWPGTTQEVVLPELERGSGLALGDGLLVAFSPEREDPGNPQFVTRTIPKLVGGLDARSGELAVALYELAVDQVVHVSSAAVAESAKLFENIFRSVNIALVNELKVILDRMGIDVWEVIAASATKPFGFMPFWPGPGLGGHCIPVDPFYLSWKAKEFGADCRFIELAGQINRAMPRWVVGRVAECLNQRGKAVKGSRVLILGMAYKPDVDDMRESPSLELMRLLESRGAVVDYHDPYIPELPSTRHFPEYAGRRSQEPAAAYDCFLLATAHAPYTPEWVLAHGVPVVDTRNALPDHPLVVRG
ncbi:MAG: nucleotide sugar dehydrogenase [Planctomycetota bacterium]